MTYRLEIRPDALVDIEEAARWYDEQQSGLGSEFAREVIEAIETVLKNPLSYRLRTNGRMFLENYSTDFLTASCFESQKISSQL